MLCLCADPSAVRGDEKSERIDDSRLERCVAKCVAADDRLFGDDGSADVAGGAADRNHDDRPSDGSGHRALAGGDH